MKQKFIKLVLLIRPALRSPKGVPLRLGVAGSQGLLALALICSLAISGCVPINTETATDPVDQGKLLYTFGVFGDNDSINETFEEIISQLQSSEALFVVGTGDHTNGSGKLEFQNFRDYMETNMGLPYYVAIGDNDRTINSNGIRTVEDFEAIMPNPRNHRFDFQGSQFFIIDSSNEKIGFATEDLEWLEENLAIYENDPVFIITHIPPQIPYGKLFSEISEEKASSEAEFVRIVQEYNVDRIFSGHLHSYLEYSVGIDNPVPVTVSGGAGAKAQIGENDFHYLKINVYENGHEVEKHALP